MSADLPKAVLESADITAITQLILREREDRDLGRWDDMRQCFWPDSHVGVSWFQGSGDDFVTGSIDMARRNVLAKHRLAPIRVRLNGDRAIATLAAIIDLPVTLQGVPMNLAAYARFLYRAERRQGRWGIKSFDAIFMRDELIPAIPGQSISVKPEEVKRFRPSYRMLSYYLTTQGYEVNLNLPGEDRPELVEAFFREVYGWAGLHPDGDGLKRAAY